MALFDPTRNVAQEHAKQRQHFSQIEAWVLDCIDSRTSNVEVSLQQVSCCGEPFCAPINILCTLLFSSNSYTFKIPTSAEDCTPQLIQEVLPPAVILQKLQQGQSAYSLRYLVGTKVRAKVGPETWLPGTIVAQWYRHANLYVPYKVKLVDGRAITVPHDDDACLVYDKDATHGGSCC